MMEKRMEAVESSLSELNAKFKELGQAISSGFVKIDHNFEHVVKEMTSLQREIGRLKRKVDLLQGDTNEGFDAVSLKLEDILGEITKIGKVTGYEESFKNMEGLN